MEGSVFSLAFHSRVENRDCASLCVICVWSYFSKWVNPQPILHSKTLGGFSSVSFPWDHETSIKKRFAFSVSKLSVLRQEPRKQQSSHRPSEFVQCFPAQLPAGECSTGIQDGIPPWTSSVLPWASVSTTWSLSAADLNVSEMETDSFSWPRAFLYLDNSFLFSVSEWSKLI